MVFPEHSYFAFYSKRYEELLSIGMFNRQKPITFESLIEMDSNLAGAECG